VADRARTTTSGVRRHRLELHEPTSYRFEPRLVTPEPPPLPPKPPGPFGDLSLAIVMDIDGV
jgi:hypothetical protein